MIVNNVLSRLSSMNPSSAIRSVATSEIDALNCVKVAIIEEYYPETRTAKVNLVNKVFAGLNDDGIQKTQLYPPLYPKVMFVGTPDNGMDYKVQKGDEVLVFFCDREITSWWGTGQVCQLDDFRTHHMSDCIALAGIRSQPLATPTNNDLNITSNGMGINISANSINIKADTEVKIESPSVSTTGNLSVGTGISAVVPCGGVTLTFSNGILTGVS